MEKALDLVQATTGSTPVYDTIAFLTCTKCFTSYDWRWKQ
ncbi:hypothetical protein PL11201_530152 [Planktothrix sp. PCC 11201]|nr:hypothetical protein PL11201_530152 [Planktothrix sp. PCC 11201]